MALMAFTVLIAAACADESEHISRKPPEEKPVDQTPDEQQPGEPGQPGNDNPGEPEEPSGTSTLARSYETGAGQWRSYSRYEYLPDGRVSAISWKTYTPYERTGSYRYEYDGTSLKRIVTDYGDEQVFVWKDGRVERSENYRGGVLKDYTLYGYDEAGNVGAKEIHYRQPSGEYVVGFRFVYLYFTDGNLYKKLTYTPATNPADEDVLLTTETYDGYSDAPNPFPMVTILPDRSVQKNLPSSYRFEGHGSDLHYSLSYTFRDDGYPLSRTVTGVGAAETTVYKYY